VASSTNKKVVVARFERETLPGFVRTPGGFGAESLELLSPEGSVLQIPYSETKAVCFVRDFDSGAAWNEHRSFATRPKSAGLWVRLSFRDGDSMEGIVANNLLLVEPIGFHLIPPDPTFQNQRVFVPRAALTEVQVLGVVGSPLRRRKPKQLDTSDQIGLFDQSDRDL
jgi:hypothetical protein